MPNDDKQIWDAKYAESPEKWSDPDPFLLRAYDKFLRAQPPGLALDLAGGAGRHAIWLAARGWRVNIIDISEVGLCLARENATKALGAKRAEALIVTEAADLNSTRELGQALYDLTVVFRYLNRELFPALVRALKPGGTLIYSTYTIAQQQFEKGPHDPRFLLNSEELRESFAAFEVLHYDEKTDNKAVAELVARKYPGV